MRKLAQRLRRFRPGDCGLIIGYVPPRALDRDRQILVFGQRVWRKSTDLFDGALSPRANSSRNDRHRAKLSQGATLQILGGDIFERLPFGDDVDPIADLGVAGNGGKPLVGCEPAYQARDGHRLELGIGVERNYDVAACQRESLIERPRLSAVG